MPSASASSRTPGYKPRLAWFSALGSAWVFVLVTLGAFTTSIGAGMAFPDWPLSNGSLNPEGWLADIALFAEHSHRLSAGLMTTITLTLAVWLWRTESRRWLRWLAVATFSLVLVQALVGGLRVLLENHRIDMIETSVGRLFAMLHAVLAQIFVCTVAAIAAACSRSWIERDDNSPPEPTWRSRWLARLCCALLLIQLAIAAVMRHSFAGLAISTFPFSTPSGSWLPDNWDFRVGIHFAHRLMALLITVAVLGLATQLRRTPDTSMTLKAGGYALLSLIGAQIFLGAAVVLSGRNPYLATAHVIVGALTLSGVFLITWILHRDIIEAKPLKYANRTAEQTLAADFSRA